MAMVRWVIQSACLILGNPGLWVSADKMKVMREKKTQKDTCSSFQMPLHFPRYSKAEYEEMEEWKVDLLLQEYGLSFNGTLTEKRAFAMGAFLWPHQY